MRACLCACAALVSLLGVSVLCAAASPVLSTQSTVVLITGDRVTFKPGDPASLHLHPRKGREHIGFSGETRVFAGESKIYVIPDDARRLIASHRIDRELFNVTALAEIQRHSATKDRVPLIVTYSGSSPMLAAAAGASDSRTLNVIHAIALKASLEQIERLWDSVIGAKTSSASGAKALASNGAFQKIWLDRIVQTSLDQSVQQIGAPSAWSLGLQGDGVVIGVLDSGVDLSHPDLAGQVIAHQNFTSEADDVDHFGHGTHVASIIAGTGSASGGKYLGVAPHATLISAKVCDDQGYCALSDIVRGMEWAVTEQGAKIVNLSLGKSDDPEIDPAEQAINELSEQYGVLFVAAAGNDGAVGGVGSPGTADAALSVAAVDRSDGIAPFSSQGPRAEGGAIKPEISAPGVGIVAARASGAQIGDPVGDSYVALSGTSMATPHVTGAAALLAQLHPEWGPQQLKSVLIGSSRRNPALTSFQQGAGRVDVVNALRTSVTAEPMTLGFDTALWPHDDDMPISRTVTYRNEGAEPLTLNFRLEAKGPNGEAAPSGMFTFSPATLSVPVGGSATATVTANTRVNGADGLYSGALIAAIDSQTFTVPFAIERETEHYNISFSFVDSTGKPNADGSLWFIATEAIRAYNIEGSATLRLTPGRYAFLATQLEPLSQRYTAFNQAVLDLHSDQSLVLDARSAGPLEALRPRPAARPIARHFVMSQMTDLGIGFGYFFQGPVDWKMATQSFGATDPKFVSLFNMRWLDAQGSYYAAAWPQRGSLVSGPKVVELDKAAIVHATYGGAFLNGTTAEYSISAALPDIVGGGTLGSGVMLPQSRVEIYYTPESTLRWSSSLDVPLDSSNHLALQSEAVQLQAGHRYTARWNEPPFAPLLAGEVGSGNRAIRAGDTMIFTTQMFGDRGGHLGSIANNLPRYQLYANGQKLGEANGDTFVISVPKDRATYTLIAGAAQSSYRLSSSVTAEWQFESEHAEGAYATLPLLSLQLQPVLNSQGAAHRGVPFVIPIQTQESAHIRELFVEASFDEGKSWSRVAVVGRGAHWQALLKHPAKGDFASLRMTATDLNDNRLRETVIRAYALSD